MDIVSFSKLCNSFCVYQVDVKRKTCYAIDNVESETTMTHRRVDMWSTHLKRVREVEYVVWKVMLESRSYEVDTTLKDAATATTLIDLTDTLLNKMQFH